MLRSQVLDCLRELPDSSSLYMNFETLISWINFDSRMSFDLDIEDYEEFPRFCDQIVCLFPNVKSKGVYHYDGRLSQYRIYLEDLKMRFGYTYREKSKPHFTIENLRQSLNGKISTLQPFPDVDLCLLHVSEKRLVPILSSIPNICLYSELSELTELFWKRYYCYLWCIHFIIKMEKKGWTTEASIDQPDTEFPFIRGQGEDTIIFEGDVEKNVKVLLKDFPQGVNVEGGVILPLQTRITN